MSAILAPQFVPMGDHSGRIARIGLVAALVVLAASIAALLVVPRYSRPVAPADVGTIAPDFSLRDPTGQTVTLADQRGKIVVLMFDSSRTATARHYRALLGKFARQYAPESRLVVLTISEPSDGALLAADTAGEPAAFVSLIDDHGAVALRYGADAAPMVVVIDPRGQVRYRGPFDDNADDAFTTQNFCSDTVRELLGGGPDAAVAERR